MLPTSTKVPDRFTPAGAEVTYLIEIPSAVTKAKYRRALTAAGGRIWTKASMIASARSTIEAANPENAGQLLEICDRYDRVDDKTPEAEAAEISKDWIDLSRVLQGTGGDFAARVADNEYWFEMAPRIAARCFLIGSEAVRLKRDADGLIGDATLEAAVPEPDIKEIGWRALALFTPSETEAKNSVSPQPSPSGPATSSAASSPQTEATGNSSAIDTAETRS